MESRDVIKALAAVEPDQLVARCWSDGLARLAAALRVAKTGPKPAVGARIVARAQRPDRLPPRRRPARTFRAESMRLWSPSWVASPAFRGTAMQRR